MNETPETNPELKVPRKLFSLKKLSITFGILAVLLIIAWGGLFAYFDHTNQFPIKTVKVIGVYQYVNQDDLEKTLKPFIVGKGLFAFSEWDAEQAIEQIPGVGSVSIWRVPPSKIKVIIRERAAIARFPDGSLLASDGVSFQTTNPSGAANLPLLRGNPLYAKDMLTMVQSLQPVFASIGAAVTGLGLAENGDWSVQLNNQTWIMLGKSDLEDRVINFLAAYPVLMKTAATGTVLSYVDLRYTHGFTASWVLVAGS